VTKTIEDGDRGDSPSRPNGPSDINTGALEPSIESADDLRALLSRAALSHSQYREFSQPSRASQQVQSDSIIGNRAPAAAGNESGDAGDADSREIIRLHLTNLDEQNGNRNPSSEVSSGAGVTEAFEIKMPHSNTANGARNVAKLKPQSKDSAQSNRKKSGSTFDSRWSVLGRALSAETGNSPSRLIQAVEGSVSLPFSFISSMRGGTGVTTILATLARCVASDGEHVLLAGSDTVSLLPLYFGAANLGEGELQSFSLPDSDGRVETVNRGKPQRPVSSPSQQLGAPEKGNLVSTILNAAADADRLLLDPGALNASDAEALQHTKAFGLIPLVPDLSCVYGMLRIEQALRPRGTKAHRSTAIFYVLNKFDASLELHRDIQVSLEKVLGERLLPITLRRSDAVAEALAEGMTVIDYCPESGIAQDFIRLADWLREGAPASRQERAE
jgi:cellulose biosynthesis protein BcsQ